MKKIETLVDCIMEIAPLFANKLDKGGKPYVEHLNRVYLGVYRHSMFIPEYVLVAAYAHDLKEDIDEFNTTEKLLTILDEKVVELIDILSHVEGENYSDYIQRICDSDNQYAMIIKLSDLEDNMNWIRLKTITDKDIERTKKYHKAYVLLSEKLKQLKIYGRKIN
jgi:hypothetical protein